MNPIATLAEDLRRGTVLSAWVSIPDPMVAGLLAREDFGAVTLDMQHTAMSLTDVARAVPSIRAAGKPALARIPVGEFQTASRLADLGLSAVIAPMINSVADARRFVSFMKFPPAGERSWGPFAALPTSGLAIDDYFRQANDFTLALAMIETRDAYDALDEILAVPGIDGVFIGPADLSIGMTGGQPPNPTGSVATDATAHIVARCRAAGRIVAGYSPTAARAKELVAMGLDLVTVESDAAFLRSSAKAALAAVRG